MANLATNRDVIALSQKERSVQTKMLMRLFELWKMTYKKQSILLGLSAKTDSTIHRYKTGKTCLPLARDIQDRAKHFFAIHRYLKQIYSINPSLAYRWMNTRNKDFHSLSPYDVIKQQGYSGVVAVRDYLEEGVLL